MSHQLIPISFVAEFNPSGPKPVLLGAKEVAFVPMASVSENGTMQVDEYKAGSDLGTGYSYFQSGDVLVAKITPCYENNKIAVARIDREHAFGSTEFHVLRPHKKQLDGQYLSYFLRQNSVRVLGQKRMTGSAGQRRVPRQFLEQLEIPLPPINEQRRIVDILDQADALRRKQRAALGLLGEMGSAVFLQLFGDPNSEKTPWPVEKLGIIGDLARGISKHRPRNEPALLGGIYPLIQTGDVAKSDGYVREYTSTYSEAGLRQSKMWPRGTLCITIAANIGKTAVLDFDACFPDSIVGFLPSKRVNTEYIQYWMRFIQKKLEDEAPQSAQKNINLAILRDLNVMVPPLGIQNSFRKFIREIDMIKASAKQHLAYLDSLFTSLQHRAFRGEL